MIFVNKLGPINPITKLTLLIIKCLKMQRLPQRCVLPVSLSVGFTTMAVINPPERKLAKRTSVQCRSMQTNNTFFEHDIRIWDFVFCIPNSSRPNGTVWNLVGTYKSATISKRIVLRKSPFCIKLVGTYPNRPNTFRQACSMISNEESILLLWLQTTFRLPNKWIH